MTISMKINFEVFSQLKDQAEANKQFLKSIKLLGEQMEAATSIDAQKIFDKFDMEVDKANDMINEIQSQMKSQETKYNKQETTDIKVTESEIENLIYGTGTNAQTVTTNEADPLEKKLEELKAKIEKK
jgi:polyhydroxyalkanoate synthesis regulator phasin